MRITGIANPWKRNRDDLERAVGAEVTGGGAALIALRYATGRFRNNPMFGLYGAAVLGFSMALHADKANRKYHTVPHEGIGGFAAIGFAEVDQERPGIVITSSGPGVRNLSTPMYDAWCDYVPLFALSGNVPRGKRGARAFQESSVAAGFSDVTKQVHVVDHPQDIADTVLTAYFQTLHAPSGPVMVDIPADVLSAPVTFRYSVDLESLIHPPTTYDEQSVQHAAGLLQAAQRPVILVGGGAKRAHAAGLLRAFIEQTGIPVAYTLRGKGVIPDGAEHNLGFAGLFGNAVPNHALQEADLILSVGARFSDRTVTCPQRFAPEAAIVHLDPQPMLRGLAWEGRERYVPVQGDIACSLDALAGKAEVHAPDDWRQTITALSHRFMERNPTRTLGETEGPRLNPLYVIQCINAAIKAGGKDTVIATDVGNHQMWAAKGLDVQQPDRYLTSGGAGTMGYGLPAAIGAMKAYPDLSYVLITGDLNFKQYSNALGMLSPYHPNDHRTIARNDLTIFVFDNSHVDRPTGAMVHAYIESQIDGTNRPKHFVPTEFTSIATGYGIEAVALENPSEVSGTVRDALAYNGPILVHVRVSPHCDVYPKMPDGHIAPESVYGPSARAARQTFPNL